MLLLLSVAWLVLRWTRWTGQLRLRPSSLYDPLTWTAALVGGVPTPAVWYGLAAVFLLCLAACWMRPTLFPARLGAALCALFLMAPEYGFGKVEHVNHLFLLAHVWAIFVPWAPARREDPDLSTRASAMRTYQAGLLMVYSFAGVWKAVDLTVRPFFRDGLTWTDPEAALYTALVYAERSGGHVDVWISLRPILELFPVAYVVLMLLFLPAALAPWRRPYLFLLIPTIVSFHILNGLMGLASFYSTAFVVTALFFPYDLLHKQPINEYQIGNSPASPMGGAAYVRQYANGDEDRFTGFYAWRTWAEEHHGWLVPALYSPIVEGLARLVFSALPRRFSSPPV